MIDKNRSAPLEPYQVPQHRFQFFTGKGGVGKTTLACATAIRLADQGRRVLLISTDPASNLDEMLKTKLSSVPSPIPEVPGLSALNIDPEIAGENYRKRVTDPFRGKMSDLELKQLAEQLSGACTIEIAAFDQFANLLGDTKWDAAFDHILFDTAPTGHTLRLLSLPKAWTEFFDANSRGASCLGPHSALTMQQAEFEAALKTLSDPLKTVVLLVSRPEKLSFSEAARTSQELGELGLTNQHLVVNGVFRAADKADVVAVALETRGRKAFEGISETLRSLPCSFLPLREFNMVGIEALRNVLLPTAVAGVETYFTQRAKPEFPTLDSLLQELREASRGLVMVMGKGGVGKTTIASAIAVGLVEAGHTVHLSTTDPAAHIAATIEGVVPGLEVSRIDPKAETSDYIKKVIASKGKGADADTLALLKEDLRSPCTEEVAVFHAFSKIVSEAAQNFVVLDTAPTGHTLLLLDATGSYHREVVKKMAKQTTGKITTPLMRIQDPAFTRIFIVTLAEPTPVSEAAQLQEDLRRAGIEPYAWVINSSLSATGTNDPLLRHRIELETEQISRVASGLAKRYAVVPWSAEEPVGKSPLARLLH